MRISRLCLAVALALCGGIEMTLAQDVENGRRLSERWCTECHAIGSTPAKRNRASPFSAIAAKEAIDADMIASFLLLPHATMPNLPLSRKDAQDIAAFIIGMKR
jgi:mono/diheme cytochrome c family protein